MTPQLKAAIAVIQSLSPIERQQLLQILTQGNFSSNSQPDLKMMSAQFWQGTSLFPSRLLDCSNSATPRLAVSHSQQQRFYKHSQFTPRHPSS